LYKKHIEEKVRIERMKALKEKQRLERLIEEEKMKILSRKKKNKKRVPVCVTNLNSFSANYVPYIEVEEGEALILLKNGVKRWKLPYIHTAPIPIERLIVKNNTHGKLRIFRGKRGYLFEIDGYYECLSFLKENPYPFILWRLNYEEGGEGKCVLILLYDCITNAHNSKISRFIETKNSAGIAKTSTNTAT